MLFRFAVTDAAVFDVLTTDVELERCRQLLRGELAAELDTVRMGSFGPFDVSLTIGPDKTSATIFICGPIVDPPFRGEQTAGAYLTRSELLEVLDETKSFQAAV